MTGGDAADPLIVSLTLNPEAHAFFDALRTSYFPAARLQVGAHVTLFHAIPAHHEAILRQHAAVLADTTAPFPVMVKRLRFLGRGVAYDLTAPAAKTLRARLAALFGDLTPQDRAPWSPHITIQNKVTPAEARHTQAVLETIPLPEQIIATGIGLWRYRGGPWQMLEEHAFLI